MLTYKSFLQNVPKIKIIISLTALFFYVTLALIVIVIFFLHILANVALNIIDSKEKLVNFKFSQKLDV